MKSKFLAMLLALSAISYSSCTKEEDEPPPTVEEPKVYQLPGLYIGTYTVNQLPNVAPLRYVLAIEPDGTITTEGLGGDGKTYYHQGTWTLTGTTVKATYKTINRTSNEVTQSATLTFDEKEGTLNDGTWKDVINSQGYIDGKFGKFTRVKDNP
ncbi:MAG: hypothetical protein ABW007_04625 [Chitinophagaceae bacterium]